MGIVLKQTFTNTIITYVGFALGAVNALFLYTKFLSTEYYGLVGVILSTSAILMPLMAFGVQNTLVKYYSSFKKPDAFLTLMLLLPLITILPIALFSFVANEAIGTFLAQKNAIVKGYVWHIFLIGLAHAYFEVFYAYARVHLKSIFGNFVKEVFPRLGIALLLLLVYAKVMSVTTFINALVVLYLARTLLIKIYAYTLYPLRISFNFPENTKTIIAYSGLIILGGSAAVILLEVDKFMINQYIEIENVAYYAVAIQIATVIIAPSRAMHQITYPLTAKLMNNNDLKGLSRLYQKSSLTLFLVSGLVFLMVMVNLNDLFSLLPPDYREGFYVVLLISLTKVYDSFLGCNNSILFNSDYYKAVLVLGVFLALITVVFNTWFIPLYGMEGAAIATFLAIFIYNTCKIMYVYAKFKMWPFSVASIKVLALIVGVGIPFYLLQLPFHPIVNILLKLFFMTLLFVGLIYRFKISEDVYNVIRKYLKRS